MRIQDYMPSAHNTYVTHLFHDDGRTMPDDGDKMFCGKGFREPGWTGYNFHTTALTFSANFDYCVECLEVLLAKTKLMYPGDKAGIERLEKHLRTAKARYKTDYK